MQSDDHARPFVRCGSGLVWLLADEGSDSHASPNSVLQSGTGGVLQRPRAVKRRVGLARRRLLRQACIPDLEVTGGCSGCAGGRGDDGSREARVVRGMHEKRVAVSLLCNNADSTAACGPKQQVEGIMTASAGSELGGPRRCAGSSGDYRARPRRTGQRMLVCVFNRSTASLSAAQRGKNRWTGATPTRPACEMAGRRTFGGSLLVEVSWETLLMKMTSWRSL